MERIELCLPPDVMTRVRKIAAARGLSLDELIIRYIEIGLGDRPAAEAMIGMFADEPELMQEISRMAMEDRKRHRAS